MATTVTTLKTRIADTLDRTDLGTYIPTWLATAHLTIQQLHNWDVQKATQRKLASAVSYNFAVASDYKAPRQLFRVGGTDITVDLVPTADTSGASPFYEARSFEDVLIQRSDNKLDNAETDQTTCRMFTVENGSVEIVPKNNGSGDHFAFLYYKLLDLPADGASDWFTNNCFDYLLYESLLQAKPFLGEADELILAWTVLRDAARARLVGIHVGLEYNAAELVMRG